MRSLYYSFFLLIAGSTSAQDPCEKTDSLLFHFPGIKTITVTYHDPSFSKTICRSDYSKTGKLLKQVNYAQSGDVSSKDKIDAKWNYTYDSADSLISLLFWTPYSVRKDSIVYDPTHTEKKAFVQDGRAMYTEKTIFLGNKIQSKLTVYKGTPAPNFESYDYYPSGTIKRKKIVQNKVDTVTFLYDEYGRLLSRGPFQFKMEGNMLKDGNTTNYYDVQNRLLKVEFSSQGLFEGFRLDGYSFLYVNNKKLLDRTFIKMNGYKRGEDAQIMYQDTFSGKRIYDNESRILEIDSSYAKGVSDTIWYKYKEKRLIQKIHKQSKPGESSFLYFTDYTYDKFGNVTKQREYFSDSPKQFTEYNFVYSYYQ